MNESLSDLRKIENEAVFRKHNETIQENRDYYNELAREDDQPYLIDNTNLKLEYMCECSDENCVSRVSLMSDTYNKIHQNRKRFVVKNGHEALEIEKIVEKRANYTIVDKKVKPPEKNLKLHTTDVDNT